MVPSGALPQSSERTPYTTFLEPSLTVGLMPRRWQHTLAPRNAATARGSLSVTIYLRRRRVQKVSAGRAGPKAKLMLLFILDSLGNTELLVILGAALIFFGPRKLPQLSRQIGKSLSEFRRASEDFKRTWEREVNLENLEKGTDTQDPSILDKATERIRAAREAAAREETSLEIPAAITPSVTPIDPSLVQPRSNTPADTDAKPASQPLAKQDWF